MPTKRNHGTFPTNTELAGLQATTLNNVFIMYLQTRALRRGYSAGGGAPPNYDRRRRRADPLSSAAAA